MTVGTGVMALSLQKRELIFSRKDIYSLLFFLFWSVNHIRKFTKFCCFRCLVKCFISSTEIEWHANCFVNSEWKWRTTCCPHTVKASVSTISKEIPFQFDKKIFSENSILHCYDFHRNWIWRFDSNFMLQIRRFCKL